MFSGEMHGVHVSLTEDRKLSSPSERQKKHRKEMARLSKQLKKDVASDTFLADWLNEINQYRPVFEAANEKLSTLQREQAAKDRGYRTWRQYIESVEASNRLYHLYVHGEAFQRLWKELKAQDVQLGWIYFYGPHNGGVPLRLARAVAAWHELPKFTKREREKHCKRIQRLCDDLLVLVEQITPGIEVDDPFQRANISPEQGDLLLKAFNTPDHLTEARPERSPMHRQSMTQVALRRGGIDAIWCIKNVKAAASREWSMRSAPTKIKSKSAFQTYLILELDSLINSIFGQIKSVHTLIADVVAELADTDCSADDVRHAIKNRQAEDSGS